MYSSTGAYIVYPTKPYQIEETPKRYFMGISECLWDKLTLEQINQPMSLSCPCRKCSTYS